MIEGDDSWNKCMQIIDSLESQVDEALIDHEFAGENCEMKLTSKHLQSKEFEFTCNEDYKLPEEP